MAKRVSRSIVRKYLNADALLWTIRKEFARIPDHRTSMARICLTDVLMAAFSMFFFKDPSALSFDDDRRKNGGGHNLGPLLGIEHIVSDTRMREVLDPVPPDLLRPAYKAVFRHLQRGKALENMVFMEGYYLMGLDGTGTFSSDKLHSPLCMEKHSSAGNTTYYLQMLGAALIHPDRKEVIPLPPEIIRKGDGQDKNDCERNAAKRLLDHLHEDHPRLKVIVTEDALSSNAPHIREIQRHGHAFILAVKPGDHEFLFKAYDRALKEGRGTELIIEDNENGSIHYFRFVNSLPLNGSNQDIRVNFLDYWQTDGNKAIYHNTWITQFPITRENIFQIMRGGRARWKMENENFNTLKNQGYRLEHNYGLGEQYLSMVFIFLMVLAFFIDQVLQLCCSFFQSAWKRLGSKRALWERMRGLLVDYTFYSMQMLYLALIHGYEKPVPRLVFDDTS